MQSVRPPSLTPFLALPPSLDLVKSENNFDVRTGGGWIVGTTDSLKRPPFVSKGKSPKCRKNEERRRNRRGKHKQTGRRKKQACVQADRSEFNKHVTDLITAEYREQHGQVPGATLNQNREMIEWKFDQMDINRYVNPIIDFPK